MAATLTARQYNVSTALAGITEASALLHSTGTHGPDVIGSPPRVPNSKPARPSMAARPSILWQPGPRQQSAPRSSIAARIDYSQRLICKFASSPSLICRPPRLHGPPRVPPFICIPPDSSIAARLSFASRHCSPPPSLADALSQNLSADNSTRSTSGVAGPDMLSQHGAPHLHLPWSTVANSLTDSAPHSSPQ